MVTVPQVSRQAGQSAQSQAHSVAPVQDQTGRQLQQTGQALQMAGAGVQQLGIMQRELQERADVTAVKQADTVAAIDIDNALRGEGGYLHTVEGQAVDGYAGTQEKLNAIKMRVSGNLTNDNQKARFAEIIDARIAQANTRAASHYEGQSRQQALRVSQDRFLILSRDYKDADSPEAERNAMDGMMDELGQSASMLGLSPEQAAVRKIERMTPVHAGVVQKLIDEEQFDVAGQYLAANKEGMVGAIHSKMSGQLKKLRKNQDLSDVATKIISRAPKGSTLAQTRLHALETAREMNMPVDDKNHLLRHLDHQHQQAMEMRATQVNVAMEQAQGELASLPSSTPTESLRSFQALEELGLVSAFNKQRVSSQTTSPELARVMFDLESGAETTDQNGDTYTLATMTVAQVDAIIGQYGGATEADKMRFRRMVVSRNPELGDTEQQAKEKRIEDIRLSAVKLAARSALTAEQRAALDNGRYGDAEVRANAAHQLGRFMNYFQDRLPTNKGLTDDNAVESYQEKLDELSADMPYRRADAYFDDFSRQLPSDFEPDERRFYMVDKDGNPDTPPEMVGDDLGDPGRHEARLQRANLMRTEYWHNLIPRQRGESAEAWKIRINESGLEAYSPTEQDIIEDLLRNPNR